MALDNFHGESPGDLPLHYHIGQLEISVAGSVEWLRLVVDLWVERLDLSLDDSGASQWLVTDWFAERWHRVSVVNKLPLCRLSSVQIPIAPGCDDGAVGSLFAVLQPRLHEIAAELVSQIPAPQLFDGAGESTESRIVEPHTDDGPWQEKQTVTFFSNLVP